MPTYVYKFVDSGETIEVQQSFEEPTLTEAPHPEGGDLRAVKKVFTPVGVTFKGNGFYKTDSRGANGSSRGANGSSSSSSSEGGSSSEGASSSDGATSPSSAPAKDSAKSSSSASSSSANGSSGKPSSGDSH